MAPVPSCRSRSARSRSPWRTKVGPLARARMLKLSEGVERCEVLAEYGHSFAWKAEDRLARMPNESMLEREAGWVSMPAGAEQGRAASPLAPRVQ